MRIKGAILLIAVCLFQFTSQSDNDEENAVDFDFGDVLQTFFESDSGKHISNALYNMGASRNANQILEGIGAVLGGDSKDGYLNPAFLKQAFEVMTGTGTDDDGSDIISWLIEIFGKEGGLENLMNILPMMYSAFNSFVEQEGQKGESSGHDWLLHTITEKGQEYVRQFFNSQVGKIVHGFISATPLYKMFTDEDGSFNFLKLGETLENHSFRKYWLEVVASYIKPFVTRMFDPAVRSRIISTLEEQLNNMLLSKGLPKEILFSAKEPVKSISALVDFAIEEQFGYEIESKQYVKPIYEYFKSIYNNVLYKEYFGGQKVNQQDLSKQVTDVINLELIEPIVRVYRAYRFAKKNKKCDKYVMCLVNQEVPDKTVNLPKVKSFLYKSSSLAASWILSGHTKTSFWTLYGNVMDNKDCEDVFHKSCEDFHGEEVRVKKEYVHSEL